MPWCCGHAVRRGGPPRRGDRDESDRQGPARRLRQRGEFHRLARAAAGVRGPRRVPGQDPDDSRNGEPENLRGQAVTASLFTLLRVGPRLGQLFGADRESGRPRSGGAAQRWPVAPPLRRRSRRSSARQWRSIRAPTKSSASWRRSSRFRWARCGRPTSGCRGCRRRTSTRAATATTATTTPR